MAQVKSVWAKYFELEPAAEEENNVSRGDKARLDTYVSYVDQENDEIESC